MKFIILSSFLMTSAFAYHSSPVGHPQKEAYQAPEQRVPASDVKPAPKQDIKDDKKPADVKK